MPNDDIRMLNKYKIERESCIRMRDHAKKALDKMTEAGETIPRINRQKMMIMNLSGNITRLNDRIFEIEKKMGIPCRGETAGAYTGTA